jgi:hypothetical protein
MKNITLAISIAAIAFTGCMTSKTTTTSPTGGVTVVTTVNEANLALDCAGIQMVTAGAISYVAQKAPSAIPVLKDTQTALDGVLNGSNPMTTSELLMLLQVNDNQVLTDQVTSLVKIVSAQEQQLLTKYGSKVGGEIAIAITKAVNNGFVIGLAGK